MLSLRVYLCILGVDLEQLPPPSLAQPTCREWSFGFEPHPASEARQNTMCYLVEALYRYWEKRWVSHQEKISVMLIAMGSICTYASDLHPRAVVLFTPASTRLIRTSYNTTKPNARIRYSAYLPHLEHTDTRSIHNAIKYKTTQPTTEATDTNPIQTLVREPDIPRDQIYASTATA